VWGREPINKNMKEKTRFSIIIFTLILLLSIYANGVLAHPGRTDSSGCHTCRTNCSSWGLSSGEYHCHRAKSLPQPTSPIKSTYGEGGTGYTQPAPEYKNTLTPSPKNTNEPKVVVNKSTETQPKRGFWQWFLGLFK